MIREPRFDEGEFERLKAERLADILQSRSDPGRLADETFLMHAYAADTPYRRLSAYSPRRSRPCRVTTWSPSTTPTTGRAWPTW